MPFPFNLIFLSSFERIVCGGCGGICLNLCMQITKSILIQSTVKFSIQCVYVTYVFYFLELHTCFYIERVKLPRWERKHLWHVWNALSLFLSREERMCTHEALSLHSPYHHHHHRHNIIQLLEQQYTYDDMDRAQWMRRLCNRTRDSIFELHTKIGKFCLRRIQKAEGYNFFGLFMDVHARVFL